jgi:hypothetical protein
MLKGDFTALRESVTDSARAERYAGYLDQSVKRLEAESGPVMGFDVLGTSRTWWTTGDDLATFVRLRCAQATRVFRIHWRDGSVTAIGGDGIPSPARTPLAPTSTATFLGFHMGFVWPVQVSFPQPARDGATRMEVTRQGQTIVARRTPSK